MDSEGRYIIGLILVLIVLIAVACSAAFMNDSRPPKRIVDVEAGVVCYTYRDSISCVPEMLTKLKSGPEAR